MLQDILAVGGFIVAIVAGIILPIWLRLKSQGRPKLIPITSHDPQTQKQLFPDMIQVRNGGSAPATDILGVIFPEQYTGQHPHGAKYIPKGHSVEGQKEIIIYHPQPGDPQPGDTNIPPKWKIGKYTFGPPTTSAGIISRLTLTYRDDGGTTYGSIFDNDQGLRWTQIAHLRGIKRNIEALERERQRRDNENLPLKRPPANSDARGRRWFLITCGGIAAAGLTLGGTEATGMFSPKMRGNNGVPGSTPTPSPSPTLTPGVVGKSLLTYHSHSDTVYGVAWSPDGTRIASGSKDKSVRIWDATTGNDILSSPYQGHQSNVNAVAWSPDGKYVASGSTDFTVQVWAVATGQTIYTYRGHSSAVFTVAWSPDGNLIASGGYDNTVQVWEASSGKPISSYLHAGAVYSVAWSPDGHYLASGSADKAVQVWETASKKLIYIYHGHSDWVQAVAWSPNGTRIASGGANADKTVQVWEAINGQSVFTYRGHLHGVKAVVWSPDGMHIASGSDDATIQVWNAGDGSNPFTYRGHSDSVEAASWQPNGKLIASGGDDKTVQVWQGE